MSSEKINLIRKIRVELDNITIDCFDKKYPSYISNSLCTVLNMLDRTCIDLYEHKKRGDKWVARSHVLFVRIKQMNISLAF